MDISVQNQKGSCVGPMGTGLLGVGLGLTQTAGGPSKGRGGSTWVK